MTHPFTPTYIAMAKAAEEVQSGDLDHPGNYFISCDGVVYINPNFPDCEEAPIIHRWLPRLDQLLGMLGTFEEQVALMGYECFAEAPPPAWMGTGRYLDWHELALAMVMREKHGKTWTGTQWRKE